MGQDDSDLRSESVGGTYPTPGGTGMRKPHGWSASRRVRLLADVWARFAIALTLIVLFGSTIGCRGRGALEATDDLVPRWWTGNPWGPEAAAARAQHRLPAIPDNPEMVAWRDWSRHHLRDGDILFRSADARVVGGLVPFSKIAAVISDSAYVHTGIAAWEDGEPVVYDTTLGGPRRQPFAIWSLDTKGEFGIKRLRAEHQHVIPKALQYCRMTYQVQTQFDDKLSLDDEELYCAEMTEKAYRWAGLPLSEPIVMRDLPNWKRFPVLTRLAPLVSSIRPETPVIVPGNTRFGIWASPWLETIYQSPYGRRPDPAGLRSGSGQLVDQSEGSEGSVQIARTQDETSMN